MGPVDPYGMLNRLDQDMADPRDGLTLNPDAELERLERDVARNRTGITMASEEARERAYNEAMRGRETRTLRELQEMAPKSDRLSDIISRVRATAPFVDDLNAYAETGGDGEVVIVGEKFIDGLAEAVPAALVASMELCQFFQVQMSGLTERLRRTQTRIASLNIAEKMLGKEVDELKAKVSALDALRVAELSAKDALHAEVNKLRSVTTDAILETKRTHDEMIDLLDRLDAYDPEWREKLGLESKEKRQTAPDELDWLDTLTGLGG